MTLGERLKKARLAKGLSQTQLAGDRITRNMLSQIESGTASPSVKTLEYLAQQLGVSTGWLLTGEDGSRLQTAKRKLRDGDLDGALEACRTAGASGDEGQLLLALIHGRMARRAIQQGSYSEAAVQARASLGANEKTLYASRDLELGMLWILTRCGLEGVTDTEQAGSDFRAKYNAAGWEARNHLLQARMHLTQQNLQAADREIWTITALPEDQRADYLLLRGRLAASQDKYGAALSFLHQAEEAAGERRALLGEIWEQLEICCRELEDFRGAYEYAAKRRDLGI